QREPQETFRPIDFHPAVKKDIKRLDPQIARAAHETISNMAMGQRHASTHPLHGPLKGWEATDITGFANHRITHRSIPGGPIEIGHIGPHNYDQAVQRLAMGQAGPDYNNLSFEHEEHGAWGKPTIYAQHPEHGNVGSLRYIHMDAGDHYATDE